MATLPLDADDPRVVGPYTLRARLGEGGMGVVYLADGPDGPVALKVVRRLLAADETFRTRFRREVLSARRVSGRGVVQLLDADTESDRPYLAMAYVEGPTLLDEVTTSGPLRGDRLRALAVALAEAVGTIHRAGVTHRDLKPGNVLLTQDQPVVVDFGVATATEATSITVVGTVMGSPGWMAPEQVTGGPPSPAMDVFALGTLVAWAATGQNPFGTGRPEAVAYRIIHDEPDLDGVPDDLAEIVRGALAKDPEARPSADEVLARLLGDAPQSPPEALAADATALLARTWVQTPVQPPAPPPAPLAAPAPRPATPHRKRGRRSALIALVLLLAAGLGVGAGLGIREYQDRQGEDQASSEDFPPATTTTTTTTTTIPTRPFSVRWVIADDAIRDIGAACEAAEPHDASATLEVRDLEGEVLAGPLEAGEGTAELGDGALDDLLGFTSCVYIVDFGAVAETDGYVLVPDTGDGPFTVAPDDLDAGDGQIEIVVNTGPF